MTKVDRAALLKQFADIDQQIGDALTESVDLRMRLAFEQVISTAAPGPKAGYRACVSPIEGDENENGSFNDCYLDRIRQLPEECKQAECLHGYGNGPHGGEAPMFGSYAQEHVRANLLMFPDLYGGSIYGKMLCSRCRRAAAVDTCQKTGLCAACQCDEL